MMVTLDFENHTDFRRREAPSALYARYLVTKVQETGNLIDKPKHGKLKTVHAPENIAAVAKRVREAPSRSFSTIEHFGDIIETNFAQRPLYDAIQSPIGSEVEVEVN